MFSSDSEARHWPIVLAGFLTVVLTTGLASSVGIFYLEWLYEYPSQSSALVGWLSSSVQMMNFGFTPVSAALVEYFGIQRVVVAGAGLSFVGLVGASFAWEFYVLLITIPFLTGIGCSMCFTGVIAATGEYFHRHFALAWGIIMSGSSVGMMIFPVVGGVLIEQLGWRGALAVLGAIQANVFVCSKFMKPVAGHSRARLIRSGEAYGSLANPPRPGLAAAGGEDDEGDEDEGDEDAGRTGRFSCFSRGSMMRSTDGETEAAQKKKWLRILARLLDRAGVSLIWSNRVYASILLTVPFPLSAVNSITLPFLAARAESVGVPKLRTTWLLSVIGVATIVGNLAFGPLVDANVIALAGILAFTQAVFVAVGVVNAVNESYGGFVVCAALFGLASGVCLPLTGVLVRRTVGQERFAGGMGGFFATAAVGYTVFSSIAGYLYDVTSSYSGAFYLSGASAAFGGVAVLAQHLLWTRLVPDDRWPTIKNR